MIKLSSQTAGNSTEAVDSALFGTRLVSRVHLTVILLKNTDDLIMT